MFIPSILARPDGSVVRYGDTSVSELVPVDDPLTQCLATFSVAGSVTLEAVAGPGDAFEILRQSCEYVSVWS